MGMIPYVRDIIASLEDPIIFEFGTHRAEHTWEIASYGFRLFYTFEPDPRNLTIIDQNGLPPRVQLIRKAIGAHEGKTILYQSTNNVEGHGVWTASNSIHSPLPHTKLASSMLKFNAQVEVDITTLDHFCSQEGIEYIDFIWADIQGAEKDLVAGGKKMIPQTRYLFLEHEKHKTYEGQWSFDEMMASLPDFELIEQFPYDVLLINKNWPYENNRNSETLSDSTPI